MPEYAYKQARRGIHTRNRNLRPAAGFRILQQELIVILKRALSAIREFSEASFKLFTVSLDFVRYWNPQAWRKASCIRREL